MPKNKMDKECNFAVWKGFTFLKVRGKGQIIEVIILLLLCWVTDRNLFLNTHEICPSRWKRERKSKAES